MNPNLITWLGIAIAWSKEIGKLDFKGENGLRIVNDEMLDHTLKNASGYREKL